MLSIRERAKNVWNAFLGRDPIPSRYGYGAGVGIRPDRPRLTRGNARSIVASVYNQIALDVASKNIQHVRVDENGKFLETIKDSLNRCLTLDANRDQTGRQFIHDLVISMFDEGAVAAVPFETDVDPTTTESFKIYKIRVAKIVEWYPRHIEVEIYDEDTGRMTRMTVEKRVCAIIENPFYMVMNEPNALAKRLLTVLNQLDRTNEQNSAGKIDLLVQLPYAVKSKAKKEIAEERRKDLEVQLMGSQYGIGYIDASERVIQLNRSVDNNLWNQAKELQDQFFSQLGFSPAIFDGTADEATMLNYQNKCLEPILTRICEEMERKWISRTAQTQGQGIRFFTDPFKLVPVAQLAEIADKFTRNCIMTSNEFRAVIGMKPSDDPKADQLINSNLNHPDEKVNVQEGNKDLDVKGDRAFVEELLKNMT